MNIRNIIRAWKDEEYRLNLSESELPAHPLGLLVVPDDHLQAVTGGTPYIPVPPPWSLGGHAALLPSST
jgi:mersacidin/lichenicidin family type 2 lantibiotic